MVDLPKTAIKKVGYTHFLVQKGVFAVTLAFRGDLAVTL
jgi:hypothetical protein